MSGETVAASTVERQQAGSGLDQKKTDRLVERLIGTMNEAGLALMLSIGHRTGLFDAMATMEASTTDQIAAKTGLSERYIREWLGAMVTGGIVDHEPTHGTYYLPREHAACLTRAAKPNNLATSMQWIAVLGGVESHVVDAFRHGKGVGYDKYTRFHEVMAEESDQTTVCGLRDHIIPLVGGLREKLERGVDALDIGCGAGRAICEMASMFPHSRFAGYDFSQEAIDSARRSALSRNLPNARFEVRDLPTVREEQAYDVIFAFDAIHDQAKPAEVLAMIRRALRPGGVFVMQDIAACSHVHHNIGRPLAPFTYAISCMHCMSVSLANGGPGLGAAWGRERALHMLRDAGFNDVTVHELPHDPINFYYICPV